MGINPVFDLILKNYGMFIIFTTPLNTIRKLLNKRYFIFFMLLNRHNNLYVPIYSYLCVNV